MLKTFIYSFAFLLAIQFYSLVSSAQAPQFKVYDNIGSSFVPLGSNNNNLAQFLLKPNDFDAPVPSGTITTIYVFVVATLNPPNITFTNFKVRMGMTQDQNTPGSGLTTNISFYDSLKVVVPAQNKVMSSVGTWAAIPLDSAFYYDGTSNLIVEISQSAYTGGISLRVNDNLTFGNRQIFGSSGSQTGSSNTGRLNFGLDIIPGVMPDMTIDTLITDPSLACDGNKIIRAVLSNNGNFDIDSFKINWELNSVPKPGISFIHALPIGASDTFIIDTVTFVQNTPMNFKVWTLEPNGVSDFNPTNDTVIQNLIALNSMPSASNIVVTTVGNDSFHFSLLNPENIDQYLWDFGDGNSSILADPEHVYAQAGNYVVTVIISNECGSDTLSKNLDLVGIKDVTLNSSILLYPNPVTEILTVQSTDRAINSILIYNVLGQVVYEDSKAAQSFAIPVSEFPRGIYLIQFTSNKKKVTKKFQKL